MAAGQGRAARGASSTACCARSPRACASWPCCCGPTCRRAPSGCWRRSAPPTLSLAGAQLGAGAIERVRRDRVAVPQGPELAARPSCDRLPHPSATCASRPTPSSSRRPSAAGVRRMLTVGIDGASCRAALAAAEAFPQVYAAVGRHPNAAHGLRRRRPRRAARAGGARALPWRSARPALTSTATARPRADQERAFAAQIALARETGKPLVIHTRAADEETLAQLAAEARRGERGDALLLDARAPGGVPGARLCDLLRRQRHLQERRRARRGRAARSPRSACWSRPTRPTSPRRPCASSATSPPSSSTRRPSWPSCAASRSRELGATRRAQRRARVRLGDERRGGACPAQPSLRRMRQFGVRPDRELGQNFLIDSNILGVIGRAAELARRGRRARDRRRPGRALRVPRRARAATCTWSRSTSACARRSRDATDAARQRHACTGATR